VSFEVSTPIKIAAALGLVLIVVAGAGSMLLGRSAGKTATQTPPLRHHTATKTTVTKTKHRTTTHKTTVTKGKHSTTVYKTTTTKTAHGTKTTTKTATVTHKHVHKAVARGNLVNADLPAPLQWQLAQHHIVVVSMYDPNSDVDQIAVAEAHAGAVQAGAGFLLVNVLDNALAGPLTALLPGGGLLPDPGVLVYRAPGNVAYRIDGFADRDAVAQAVSNAYAGENGTTISSSSSTTAAAAPTTTP
jgi:hypothetical protein